MSTNIRSNHHIWRKRMAPYHFGNTVEVSKGHGSIKTSIRRRVCCMTASSFSETRQLATCWIVDIRTEFHWTHSHCIWFAEKYPMTEILCRWLQRTVAFYDTLRCTQMHVLMCFFGFYVAMPNIWKAREKRLFCSWSNFYFLFFPVHRFANQMRSPVRKVCVWLHRWRVRRVPFGQRNKLHSIGGRWRLLSGYLVVAE